MKKNREGRMIKPTSEAPSLSEKVRRMIVKTNECPSTFFVVLNERGSTTHSSGNECCAC